MSEKVSIIVCIYNSSKFLRKCLDSIKNQTWKNIEAILIDDGSLDDSGKICDEYCNHDSRFTVIHKCNTGVCDSRNVGIKEAKGDYLCFVDGDDWLEDDFVEYFVILLTQKNTMMAISDKIFTTRDRIQTKNDQFEVWDSTKTITTILYPYMMLGPWNKMFSTKLLRENGIQFPEHWFGETLHFASTAAFYAKNIGVGHRKVYNYRLNNADSGVTKYNVSNGLLALDNSLKLRNAIFNSNKRIHNAIEWHIWSDYYFLLTQIVGSNKVKEYKNKYKECIRYIRSNAIRILLQSDVGKKEKMKILVKGISPILVAKNAIKKKRKGLNQDRFQINE